MPVEVWQYSRPKHRSPRWAFRVTGTGGHRFESAWVSVRYHTQADAVWLAERIECLIELGTFTGCPGHSGQSPHVLPWAFRMYDDFGTTLNGVHCHAEHMSGPMHGGLWYCSVYRNDETLFHTADHGIEPRSPKAAWWLCELAVSFVIVNEPT